MLITVSGLAIGADALPGAFLAEAFTLRLMFFSLARTFFGCSSDFLASTLGASFEASVVATSELLSAALTGCSGAFSATCTSGSTLASGSTLTSTTVSTTSASTATLGAASTGSASLVTVLATSGSSKGKFC